MRVPLQSLIYAIAPSLALLTASPSVDARSSYSFRAYSITPYTTHDTRTPPYVRRDGRAWIKRSVEAQDAFKHSHPCPSTGRLSGSCPGYVIDHVTALKRGGADEPSNMQWQTIQAAKLKDKTE